MRPTNESQTRLGFIVVETPGRDQPFAIWRGKHIWQFCARREDADAYIDGVRARERR